MIHTSRTMTVGKMESVINEPIMLYRGDREVEIEFDIVGSKFMFSNGGNVIKSTNATNGQLVINTPTGENMFSEVTECNDGKVICVITKEMIDELAEVGFYSFQIRLFDESQVSRVTIPPVYQGIEIRNPIAAEDETDLVDIGLVDYSVVRKNDYENVATFLPNGNYNKTNWEEHDVISKDRLNKVEDALYEINKSTEGLYPTFQNQYDEFSAKVNKDVKAYKEEMEDEVEQFERDMTQALGEFKVDYKDEVHERLDNVEGEFEEVNEQLTQITNNNINAKTLGMIANNKENAELNMSLLNEAIKKGVSVEIDDIYYIESNNTVNIGNVCIKGVSPNACLILKGSDVWNINNGLHNLISITNINLKNEDEETVNLFTNSNTFPYIDRFIFSNNKVEGNITICKLYFLNSNIEKFGFDVVDISSNIFLNCMVDNHIFNINDCPHNEIRVVNNHIHNFNKVFAYIVLENDKNIDRVMSMKKCICYGNTIFNDDDIYCINSGDKYWGFLYYEGIDVDYFNNRVEGIKVNFPSTLDGKKVGLYDSYLSAINVNHHNNIIKNNINIYADEIEQCNNFFKSKNSPYKPGIRICKNNTFIIEKDYLDKISVLTSPKFKLYEFESEIDTLVYENNLIECPNIKLTQQKYQSMKVNNFKFNNNNIVSDNINGHFYQVTCLSNINCIEFCNNLITELKGNVDYKRLGFINITQNNNITNVEINIK